MNFSSKSLPEECISALGKGLSFVPTTAINEFDTIIDFQKFFRSLRLKEMFHSGGVVADATLESNINGNLTNCDVVDGLSSNRDNASKFTKCKKKIYLHST